MNTLQQYMDKKQIMDQTMASSASTSTSTGRVINGDYYSGTGTVSVPTSGSMAYPNFSSAGIPEPQGLTEVRHREERTVSPSYGAVTLAEIDRTVKKYTDNLLHALEGVSVRLSQLEIRAHYIERSMSDLNLAVGNCTATTDGRLLQFEKTLREVQSGVQIHRDKQEIIEPTPPPRGGYQQSAPHDHQPHPPPYPPQGPPPYMQLQPPPGGFLAMHRPFFIPPPPPPLFTSAMYNQPPATVMFGGCWDGYERLPTAKVLPKAAPVAGAGSGSTGNQVPLDDVVEKVAMMGFSRDQVRDTARKLTENGQDVDLNSVLDKLMNGDDAGGDTNQPRKGWFGP